MLSMISYPTQALLEDEGKPTCETLGYKSDVVECLEAQGTPLVCPFSDGENSKCVCIKDSCRGYTLTEEDKQQEKASDGRSIDEHILSYDECTIGVGNEAQTLYKVKECKEGSLYQNGICDIGCDTLTKYPYNYHPGNLPGTVEMCVNAAGEWYGYKSCNDGWILKDGKCNLNSCDIMDYPYLTDPNIEGERGKTTTCRIGGNTYYKYTSCNTGYTLSTKGSVCIGNCEININNCSKTTVTENNITYNNWKCGLKNPDKCMIGDNATIGGKVIGTVVYISSDKTLIMGDNLGTLEWGSGAAQNVSVPNINRTYPNDFSGKKNTSAIKAFATSNGYNYPAASVCYNYETSNCTHDMCLKGEWYLPAYGELSYMYDNRYILLQVTGHSAFNGNSFWSSTEHVDTYAWGLPFSYANRTANYKYSTLYVRPILSF